MSRLVHKSLFDRPRQPVPCTKNRLLATFDCGPMADFQPAGAVIQPIFQQLGFAYPMYFRPSADVPGFSPTNINLKGPVHQLVFALILCQPKGFKPVSDQEIIKYGEICTQVGEVLTSLNMPKGWFGRRSSTGSIPKLIIPEFDKTAEKAYAMAQAYGQYLQALPAYQRHLLISVTDSPASIEEVTDFAEFAALGAPVVPGVWQDPEIGVVMSWKAGTLSLYMPSVPGTWKPEVVLDGMVDLARRFSAEFGGKLLPTAEDDARRIVAGWRNVLSPIGLQPGEEEAAEFFPPIAAS